MNSRSQTKIRKIQQTNLLAEERYLKTKGLLYEGSQEEVLKCFTDNGVEESLIPDSCKTKGVGQKFDITACAAALPGVITSVPEDKQEALKTCLMNLVDFGDIQNTINKGIKIGTDILKGTGIGIKF
jgi:hypothetical protein